LCQTNLKDNWWTYWTKPKAASIRARSEIEAWTWWGDFVLCLQVSAFLRLMEQCDTLAKKCLFLAVLQATDKSQRRRDFVQEGGHCIRVYLIKIGLFEPQTLTTHRWAGAHQEMAKLLHRRSTDRTLRDNTWEPEAAASDDGRAYED
jgi:hypothetical protein